MTGRRIVPSLGLFVTMALGCEPVKVIPEPAPTTGGGGSPTAPALDRPDASLSGGLDALAGIDPEVLGRSRDGGEGGMGQRTVACAGTDPRALPSCASLGVTIDPQYAASYTCFDLGPVPGVPPQKYGGLVLTTDKCSTTMLIGGEANLPGGKLYRVTVTRDSGGHINGFSGTGAAYIDAPYNDGGVVQGPSGVLFLTRWPSNELQQTRAGSTIADKVIDLATYGVVNSSASLNFVGPGLPGEGTLKLMSWPGGQWYTLALRPDGQGTSDVVSATAGPTLTGGPEGFVYVAAGSPLFPAHALLVSEWTKGEISTYEIDAEANPKPATRKLFIAGLQGAEGAFRDPETGDFFFSTWGQAADRVIVVRGFAPVVVIE